MAPNKPFPRLRAALRMAWQDPLELWRSVVGRYSRSLIYTASLDELPDSDENAATTCRRLTDNEVRSFSLDSNPERLVRLGVNQAYGVFIGDQLAHVSWMITKEIEPKTGDVIQLLTDEIEITACFTVPEFRGRGLYPRAIRHMMHAARQLGYRRVFMKVRPDNIGSIRGIIKAGLRRAGTAFHVESPLLPDGEIVLRTHRAFPRR